MQQTQALKLTLQTRGDLNDALGLLTRTRAPLDEAALVHEYQSALVRLLDAQATLASLGSQAAIDAGRAICIAGTEYLKKSIARTGIQRLLHLLRGWHPTARQEQNAREALETLVEAQAKFIAVMRDEMGAAQVQLLEASGQSGERV